MDNKGCFPPAVCNKYASPVEHSNTEDKEDDAHITPTSPFITKRRRKAKMQGEIIIEGGMGDVRLDND